MSQDDRFDSDAGEFGNEPTGIAPDSLTAGATFLRLMGVNYLHQRLPDGGELFVTERALGFLEHLRPENWFEHDWFTKYRVQLQGTSTVYRLPTRPIESHRCKSIDLVIKWSRVGQDVPLDTLTLARELNTDFNSPFEEFSLVEELRLGNWGRPDLHIRTQIPLAIYVPPERMQLWQTGRSTHRILSKLARHASVEIDMLRSYIMIYGWIKGIDAVAARNRNLFDFPDQQEAQRILTERVAHDLLDKGFTVTDHKPAHAIVRPHGDRLLRDRDGKIIYALVDYELLTRTPEHEEAAKSAGRGRYLFLQKNRTVAPRDLLPQHLMRASVMGVDYVFGRAASTSGKLWVVGSDPELFEYFLPERWRSKQIALSSSGRTWYVRTKDGVHLVWKVSRLGDLPPRSLNDPLGNARQEHGYNSPFEKFALAVEMQKKGLRTAYPRAIYVTAHRQEADDQIHDDRRFKQFLGLSAPDGSPVLPESADYVTIWGFWRGLEDSEAPFAEAKYSPIGAGQAAAKGLLSQADLDDILDSHQMLLLWHGYEDLNLEPDHILLSYVPGGDFKRDAQGKIETRHCNFEMVRRVGPAV